MPNITFRGKIVEVFHPDDTLAYELIKVPRLERRRLSRTRRRHPRARS